MLFQVFLILNIKSLWFKKYMYNPFKKGNVDFSVLFLNACNLVFTTVLHHFFSHFLIFFSAEVNNL